MATSYATLADNLFLCYDDLNNSGIPEGLLSNINIIGNNPAGKHFLNTSVSSVSLLDTTLLKEGNLIPSNLSISFMTPSKMEVSNTVLSSIVINQLNYLNGFFGDVHFILSDTLVTQVVISFYTPNKRVDITENLPFSDSLNYLQKIFLIDNLFMSSTNKNRLVFINNISSNLSLHSIDFIGKVLKDILVEGINLYFSNAGDISVILKDMLSLSSLTPSLLHTFSSITDYLHYLSFFSINFADSILSTLNISGDNNTDIGVILKSIFDINNLLLTKEQLNNGLLDNLSFETPIFTKEVLSILINSNIDIRIKLEDKNGSLDYDCWVFNTSKRYLSYYTDFNFSSMTEHKEDLYGTKEDGLYKIISDKKPKHTNVVYNLGDFNTSDNKVIKNAYFGISSLTGETLLRVTMDNVSKQYVLNSTRIKGAKGHRGVSLSFILQDITNLDFIMLHPILLTKRNARLL